MLKHALLCTGVVASVYVAFLSTSRAAEYGTLLRLRPCSKGPWPR